MGYVILGLSIGLIGFFIALRALMLARERKNKDLAKEICAIISPSNTFRAYYTDMFAQCQNAEERTGLLSLAQGREQEFDLRVSQIMAEHASSKDLKNWVEFYRDNPDIPFRHATEKFNDATTKLAAKLVEEIMEDMRQNMA